MSGGNLLARCTLEQQERARQEAVMLGKALIYERADGTIEVLDQTRLLILMPPQNADGPIGPAGRA